MPDKAKTAAPAKVARKPKKAAKKRAGPVSLYPLTFEEAVRGLLQVKMEPEKSGTGKKRS